MTTTFTSVTHLMIMLSTFGGRQHHQRSSHHSMTFPRTLVCMTWSAIFILQDGTLYDNSRIQSTHISSQDSQSISKLAIVFCICWETKILRILETKLLRPFEIKNYKYTWHSPSQKLLAYVCSVPLSDFTPAGRQQQGIEKTTFSSSSFQGNGLRFA